MWDTFEEMKRVQEDMNKVFSSYLGLAESKGEGKAILSLRKPLLDLKETATHLIVRLELPGLNKKDIRMDIREDRLEVMAEKREEPSAVKEDYHLRERSYKGFYRLIELPHPVIPSQSKATYQNGILEVMMPKGEKKEKQEISIE